MAEIVIAGSCRAAGRREIRNRSAWPLYVAAAVFLVLWLTALQQPASASARTITVSPSPIVAGQPFTVRGTGWASGRSVAINLCEDDNNDNCGRLGVRKVSRGKWSLRWAKGISADFTSLRVMVCYQPRCTMKMVRRVRVTG